MTEPVQREDQKLWITLLQVWAAGAFSRVYRAEARSVGGQSRVVAVKLIDGPWSAALGILTQTRDEARLLARLQHRNILRVEALAEVDGQPALVMEFVDGLDLQQLMEHLAMDGRSMPRRAVYEVMGACVSAIAAAWEAVPPDASGPLRVVHGDLKPSNIMVSMQGDVKVVDFGAARFDTPDRQARAHALFSTDTRYLSPERRLGGQAGTPAISTPWGWCFSSCWAVRHYPTCRWTQRNTTPSCPAAWRTWRTWAFRTRDGTTRCD